MRYCLSSAVAHRIIGTPSQSRAGPASRPSLNQSIPILIRGLTHAYANCRYYRSGGIHRIHRRKLARIQRTVSVRRCRAKRNHVSAASGRSPGQGLEYKPPLLHKLHEEISVGLRVLQNLPQRSQVSTAAQASTKKRHNPRHLGIAGNLPEAFPQPRRLRIL